MKKSTTTNTTRVTRLTFTQEEILDFLRAHHEIPDNVEVVVDTRDGEYSLEDLGGLRIEWTTTEGGVE